MTALSAPGAPVGSPCVNVCRMDAVTGWCDGCQRTLDEIAAWGTLDDDGRRAIWQQLAQRRLLRRQLRLQLREPAQAGTAPGDRAAT
jgi:predicted Fe-S protein YdhL (DUF1289 family)